MSSGQEVNQVAGTGGAAAAAADFGGGAGAGGQPPRHPTDRAVDHAMTDVQFAKQRSAMRERLTKCLERKLSHSSAQKRHRLPKLSMHLEELLYIKFPNKNEYYNMMMGPVEPQLMYALKTFNALRRQKRQNLQAAMQQATASSSNTNMVLNHDGLFEQSAPIPPPTQNIIADTRNITDMRLPEQQPMEDMAVHSGVDDLMFVTLRETIREKILMYIEMTPMPDKWEKNFTTTALVRRLEEVLYTKFPNKNDYYNMMNGPIEPQLMFAIKTHKAQKQQNQHDPQMAMETTSSSSGTITQDENHAGLYEQIASLMADMQYESADDLIWI